MQLDASKPASDADKGDAKPPAKGGKAKEKQKAT